MASGNSAVTAALPALAGETQAGGAAVVVDHQHQRRVLRRGRHDTVIAVVVVMPVAVAVAVFLVAAAARVLVVGAVVLAGRRRAVLAIHQAIAVGAVVAEHQRIGGIVECDQPGHVIKRGDRRALDDHAGLAAVRCHLGAGDHAVDVFLDEVAGKQREGQRAGHHRCVVRRVAVAGDGGDGFGDADAERDVIAQAND
jgi:hypothetical protein